MSMRKRITRAIVPGAVAISIIALAAILILPVAHAERSDRGGRGDNRPAVNVLPPVGITFGQTLHVTFLNTGDRPLEIVPWVLDREGEQLKTGGTHTLAPGQMRSLDLSRSELGREERSVELRAGVQVDRADLKHLIVAAEVIEEATGRGVLFVQGKRNGPEPEGPGQLTSTLAPVGISPGQTYRITYLNVGKRAIEIESCLFDADGEDITPDLTFTLAPGQMRSVELSHSEISGRGSGRIHVRGAAHVRTSDAGDLVIAGEVVDQATGGSALYVPGSFRR